MGAIERTGEAAARSSTREAVAGMTRIGIRASLSDFFAEH
jgi:hypothetical protein